MKVVLAVLSGDAALARERLNALYPDDPIRTISRTDMDRGSLLTRLSYLRAFRPDVFAISTERVEWQRGQNLFMLFGALAGAAEVVILDGHGAFRKESRASLLARAPARLAQEATLSAATLARARQQLSRLESEVKQRALRSDLASGNNNSRGSIGPAVIYLRATPAPGTQAGGSASHINGVVGGLRELGARVHLISNDVLAGMDPSTNSLELIRPEPAGLTRAAFDIHNNFVFTRSSVPLISRDAPDFIYQRYARFGWAGVVASLRTGRPLFLEYNGSEVWAGKHWDRVGMLGLLARYERLNLEAAARIFVVSEVERSNLEEAGVDEKKIVVNPNGVDTSCFRPHVGGEGVREELGVLPDETLVGFVGTFGPWHGVITLAEAIKLIGRQKGIRFLLVGTGALRIEMEQLLASEIESGVVIFTGAVEHKRVPALLDACDILASPHVPLAGGAEFFGSPTKLFEYMAMGRAIVGSRLGQIGEVLTHEETALLVEPANARQLSDAIMRLADARELRERLGVAARQVAIERHTWTANAQRVLDEFQNYHHE